MFDQLNSVCLIAVVLIKLGFACHIHVAPVNGNNENILFVVVIFAANISGGYLLEYLTR